MGHNWLNISSPQQDPAFVDCIFVARRAEHSLLLHAVLPSAAIKQLKRSAMLHQEAPDVRVESADTPAERLLLALEGMVEGVVPPLPVLASLIAALRTRQNLYAPSNLGQRIRDLAGMDVSAAWSKACTAQACMCILASACLHGCLHVPAPPHHTHGGTLCCVASCPCFC